MIRSAGGIFQTNLRTSLDMIHVHRRHMHESPFPIEAAFEESTAEVGIKSHEVSRRGAGDHSNTLNPPARGCTRDALHLGFTSLLTSPTRR